MKKINILGVMSLTMSPAWCWCLEQNGLYEHINDKKYHFAGYWQETDSPDSPFLIYGKGMNACVSQKMKTGMNRQAAVYECLAAAMESTRPWN